MSLLAPPGPDCDCGACEMARLRMTRAEIEEKYRMAKSLRFDTPKDCAEALEHWCEWFAEEADDVPTDEPRIVNAGNRAKLIEALSLCAARFRELPYSQSWPE